MKAQHEPTVVSFAADVAAAGRLPYTVELWDLTRTGPERVIGKAATALLARAIFAAAAGEHLGRRIVLRRGHKVLETTD